MIQCTQTLAVLDKTSFRKKVMQAANVFRLLWYGEGCCLDTIEEEMVIAIQVYLPTSSSSIRRQVVHQVTDASAEKANGFWVEATIEDTARA